MVVSLIPGQVAIRQQLQASAPLLPSNINWYWQKLGNKQAHWPCVQGFAALAGVWLRAVRSGHWPIDDFTLLFYCWCTVGGCDCVFDRLWYLMHKLCKLIHCWVPSCQRLAYFPVAELWSHVPMVREYRHTGSYAVIQTASIKLFV